MAVRAGGGTDPPERLDRLVSRFTVRMREAFLRALRSITDEHTLEELIELIEQGRIEEALRRIDEAGESLGNESAQAFRSAAEDTARWLSANALDVVIRFDVPNHRAVAAMQANRLRLIREFTAQQRAVAQAALVLGINQGLNPRDQARLFRNSIGLTTRQLQAVANYRRLLSANGGLPSREALQRALRDGRSDRSIERALRDATPLSASQIDSMVDRYQRRFIRYRSEVIARTEALRSVHEGTREMYRQAIDSGRVRRGEIQRTWLTRIDGRQRDSHGALHNTVRGYDETWQGFNGELRFPGDPSAPASETVQCRCALATRIVPLPRQRIPDDEAERETPRQRWSAFAAANPNPSERFGRAAADNPLFHVDGATNALRQTAEEFGAEFPLKDEGDPTVVEGDEATFLDREAAARVYSRGRVPFDLIASSQDDVDIAQVESLLDREVDPDRLPLLHPWRDGRFEVVDGNHRLVAQFLQGDADADALVFTGWVHDERTGERWRYNPDTGTVEFDRPEEVPAAPGDGDPTVQRRVFDAIDELAEDRAFVALADVREAVSDLPRDQVDAALTQFRREGNLQLQAYDQEWLVSDSDRAAALEVDGQPTHLISIANRPADLGAAPVRQERVVGLPQTQTAFRDLRAGDQFDVLDAIPRNESLIERAQDLLFEVGGRAGERVSRARDQLIAEGASAHDADRALAHTLNWRALGEDTVNDRLDRLPTLSELDTTRR